MSKHRYLIIMKLEKTTYINFTLQEKMKACLHLTYLKDNQNNERIK